MYNSFSVRAEGLEPPSRKAIFIPLQRFVQYYRIRGDYIIAAL